MGRHALVVGGTKGAGRATVRRFAEDGWSVSVIGRSEPAASNSLPDSADYFRADVADRSQTEIAIAKVVECHGNPSCIAFFQRFRGEEDSLLAELDVAFGGTQRVIDFLIRKHDLRDCSVVVAGSVNADFIGGRVSLGYHVAKSALRQLVRYYAVKLGPRGIRVNGVSPATFLKDESAEYFDSHPQLVELYRHITPLRRMGLASEVAEVVAFLGGDRSSFVTGQEITIDGGLTLSLHDSVARDLMDAMQPAK